MYFKSLTKNYIIEYTWGILFNFQRKMRLGPWSFICETKSIYERTWLHFGLSGFSSPSHTGLYSNYCCWESGNLYRMISQMSHRKANFRSHSVWDWPWRIQLNQMWNKMTWTRMETHSGAPQTDPLMCGSNYEKLEGEGGGLGYWRQFVYSNDMV